jgi:hypothetical protein
MVFATFWIRLEFWAKSLIIFDWNNRSDGYEKSSDAH